MPNSTKSALLDRLLETLAAPHRRARAIVRQELQHHNYKHATVDHVEWETALTLQLLRIFHDLKQAKNHLLRIGAMLRFLPDEVGKLPPIHEAWRAYMKASTADKIELIVFHLELIPPALNQVRQQLYGPGAVMVHAIFLLEAVLYGLPAEPDGGREQTDGLLDNLEALLEAMSVGALQMDDTWKQAYPQAKESLEHCAEALELVRGYGGSAMEEDALDLLRQHLQAALTFLKPPLQ